MSDRANAGTHAATAAANNDPHQRLDHGGGEVAIRQLLSRNSQASASEAADVLVRYPSEVDAILAYLNKTLGNAYVQDVVAAWNKQSGMPEEAEQSYGVSLPKNDVRTRAPAAKENDSVEDKYAVLLATPHAGTRGLMGSASWLLSAMDVGLVTIASGEEHKDTKTQLQQLMNDEKRIRSKEKPPSKKKEDKHAAEAKKRGIHKVKDGVYDIEIAEAPVLETLVELVIRRVETWRATGTKGSPTPLEIQNFLRADPGYGGGPHTGGLAADIGLHDGDIDGFIQTLQDLPPGAAGKVFPDGDNSFHVNNATDNNQEPVGEGFDFGFPAPFFNLEVAPDGGLNTLHKKYEGHAGADETTLDVRALMWGSTHEWSAHATKNASGTWTWSQWTDEGSHRARGHLKNQKLKAALDALPDKE